MADKDWELRSRVQAYLLGEQNLRAFQRWFMPFIWQEDRSASPLARAVELALAEYTSGHRTEPEFRLFLLKSLVGTASADLSETEDWTADNAPFDIETAPLSRP
jgi:hypothetical protein